MSARLYHYCERYSCADVVTSGILRAKSQTLHEDMLGLDAGLETPPLVWLTLSDAPDGVVVAKMLLAGWPKSLASDLCRICLPADYPSAAPLDAYSGATGIAPGWWRWVIQTGAMAGSHWRDWRICPHDVPAADWLAVETLSSAEPSWAWRPYA